MRSQAIFLLTTSIAVLAACPADPPPNDPTGSGTTEPSDGTTQGPGTTSLPSTGATTGDDTTGGTTEGATTSGSTTSGSTTSGSTGIDPSAMPTDCDALSDEAACDAVRGLDFQCGWIAEAYAVELDGETCSVGDAIGWCVAQFDGESGCVDDYYHGCTEGGVPSLFVREVEGGPTVMVQGQGFGLLEYGCGRPVLWEVCTGEGSPAACDCGCDPGLPG